MQNQTITTSGRKKDTKVVSSHIFAKVLLNKTTGQKSLHAVTHFYPGDVICRFSAGITQPFATYLTVQIGVDKHITLVPEFLQYTNHSCAPTVFFDTTTMELVCLEALQPGDELTFFYPSTEWEMVQPFICNCGKPECLQLINGASHLSGDVLEKYRLTDFIRQMIQSASLPTHKHRSNKA
jgi:hypothetical protein